METARTIKNDGIELACRDLGGDGPPLVLLHGAGAAQGSMLAVGRLLTGHRVITFDFRGHGRSGTGPWTLESALSDLAAVIAAYGLTEPVVAGHSLGGMVAAAFAGTPGACRAAINIDGQGQGSPTQYVGQDPAQVQVWMDAQAARAQKLLQGPLMKLVGLVQRTLRSPVTDREAMTEILTLVGDLDLLEVYARATSPLLIINAHGATVGVAKRMANDPNGYADAYRKGLSRDVRALGETHPLVRLAEIDASHALVRTHAQQTAEIVLDFLRET